MILAQRKAKNMTQEELAAKVQKSRAQVANIEGGRSDLPIKTLMAFAVALGCSPRDLVPEGCQ
jgi:transcriptional regulator with XRE-family HTH domain